MGQLSNESEDQRLFNVSRRVGSVAGGYSVGRIKKLGAFTAASHERAMIYVDAILGRGHFAALRNVANSYVVTESVLL